MTQLIGTEISQLDPAATLNGTEVVPGDQSGRTVRMTTQQIANLAAGASSVGGAVATVNGQTGTVVLHASDVGLGSVDNTSDQTKNSAAVILTNKTIDGTQNTLTNIGQGSVTGLTAALASVVNTAGTGLGLSGNTISLANTAVAPAQYGTVASVPQITVDQQGRITGAVELSLVIPQAQVTGLTASFAAKAPVASPTFTGIATAPVYAITGGTGAATPVRWIGGTTSAAPTTGTWLTGDGVIGTGGKVYICTAGGTPGTWVDAGSGSSGPPTGSAGGDLAGSGSTYPNPVIANGAVTLAKQANLAGLSLIGNSSGSAAPPQALNATAVKSLLAIAESDVASLTADLAALAPQANPTFTGTVTQPIVQGGTAAGSTLTIKATSAGSPTGTVDMVGNGTTTFRQRITDGHIAIGTDVLTGVLVSANCQLLISSRDNTVTYNTWPTSAGTGLFVVGSTAEPKRVAAGKHGNMANIQSVYDIDNGTGGDGAEHISILGISRMWDATYNGCSVALQGYGYTNANTSDGLHANASLPFGADIKGRVANTVTDASHPAVTGIETGGADDSTHRQTNVGLGVRFTNQGRNHIRNAMLVSNTSSLPGSWENGLVISTSTLGNLYVNVYSASTVYVGGELVNIAGTKYVCIAAVTGGAGPATDTTHWFAVGAIGVPPTWVTGRDHDVHTLVTDAGATWACAVAHTNGTTAPNLDQWNGFNGTAGPTGAASGTASVGHWVPWTNRVGITDRYVNTGLTSHTTSPGYPIWIGPVGGSGMAANAPTGTGQDFSVDTSANLTVGGNVGFNGQAPQALTGWVAPTGTLSRATFNQSTATTASNAQRLAALITDLIANGVIG